MLYQKVMHRCFYIVSHGVSSVENVLKSSCFLTAQANIWLINIDSFSYDGNDWVFFKLFKEKLKQTKQTANYRSQHSKN